MEINRHNYEIFFIDYFEGNLSKSQIEDLMRFISLNNDLENEFYEFNDIKLVPDEEKISFEKKSLKKSGKDFIITKENFEENCIAKIEGDLRYDDEIIFDKYLKYNPEKESVFNLYEKTILEPDLSIVFDEKSKIKRHFIGTRKTNRSFVQYISGAAAVIIILAFFININNGEKGELLRNNASLINIKNNREVIPAKEQFSIVKTEKPAIVSQSSAKTNQNRVKSSPYQYVDHKKAIFISDFISNLSNYSTEINEDLIIINKNKLQNSNEKNNQIASLDNNDDNEKNIVFISPKQVSVVSGELNSEDFLSAVIESLNADIETNQSTQKNNKLTFWDIAETGLKSYEALTGNKVDLEKKYNEDGKLASLDFSTSKFGFSKKFKK